MDYKSSGVDVEAGDDLVRWLSGESSKGSKDPRLISGIGGFAAVFRANFPGMNKPCLVSSTDGVGTKLLWGIAAKRYEGLGQDLVAMCVNDLVCCGAEPLFFLDYFACGRLDKAQAQGFLKGVKDACEESECLLIGGETAEMPGMYSQNHFDCAGFSVGVVDEDEMWGAHRVVEGDRVVALKSSGFHSNGYSLLRKVFEQDWQERVQEMLQPTRLYVRAVKDLKKKEVEIHAAAHITGGGINNISRVLPDHLKVKVKSWEIPPLFLEVERRAKMSRRSLLETLNCGLGLVLILPGEEAQRVTDMYGGEVLDLGSVEARGEGGPLDIEEVV